jgi:hypothetical protein
MHLKQKKKDKKLQETKPKAWIGVENRNPYMLITLTEALNQFLTRACQSSGV